MILHSESSFLVYFGDAQDRCPSGKQEVQSGLTVGQVISLLQEKLHLTTVSTLKQTHSATGLVISCHEYAMSDGAHVHEGDYLITPVTRAGLAVFTADCLPIVVYDSLHDIVGIAHSGWRGTVANIVSVMVKHMMRDFDSQINNMHFFLGPCAKVCCYEVSEDFITHIEQFSFLDKILIKKSNKLMFDNIACNLLLLEQLGVEPEAVSTEYALCTMCHDTFYSHRRDGSAAGSNVTIVALK